MNRIQQDQPKHKTDKRLKPFLSQQFLKNNHQTPFKIKHATNQEQLPKLFTATTNTYYQYPQYNDPTIQKTNYFKFQHISNNQTFMTTDTNSKYQFSCFNIKHQKQQGNNDFMGAFTHLQQDLKNPFDINIKIPSLNQYSAFSNIFQFSKNSLINETIPKIQTHSLLLNQLQDSISQTSQRRKILQLEDSIFLNLQPILNYKVPERNISNMWEESEFPLNNQTLKQSSLIYSAILQNKTQKYQNNNSFFFEKPTKKISEQIIINHLTKVLQGIQTEYFRLDFTTMSWSIVNDLNLRIQNYFKQSFEYFLENSIQLANYKSRIEVALQYLRIKDVNNNKFIYTQVYYVYLQCLTLLESVLMEFLQSNISFLEFQLSIRKLKAEIKLLYTFLIKQNGKYYYQFDHSFLYTQRQLFNMGLNRLTLNDFSQENQKILIKKLTYGSFKPILYSLNIILHYGSKQWQHQYYHHYYFSIFFDKKKELLQIINKMTSRLNSLQVQDHQIYMICRQKKKIQLMTCYNDLKQYEREWNELFKKKIGYIKQIEAKYILKRKKKLDEIYEKKAAEIAQMKLKLIKKIEQQMKLRQQNKLKQNNYIQRLQIEIKKKQQQQRLNKLIEIQREKGYLLQAELQQKRKLINYKYELLSKHPQIIQQNMVRVDSNNKMIIEQQQKIQQNKQNYHFKEKNNIEEQSDILQQKQSIKMMQQSQNQQIQTILSQKRNQQIKSIQKQLKQQQQSIQNQNQPPQLPNMILQNKQHIQIQVPIENILEICVINIINKQLQVLNSAISTLIYDKYLVHSIFEFFRVFFLSAKGHYFIQLLELAVDKNSNINLNYFKQCFFFDPSIIKQQILNLQPNFYKISNNQLELNLKTLNVMGTVNLLEQNLDVILAFEFRSMPMILKPYFSYIHLTKYMQIFNFILKLRHCESLIQAQWKTLNHYEKVLQKEGYKLYEMKLIKQLYSIRYHIQTFLLQYQNYLYFYVIQKQYKTIKTYLNSKQFENLAQVHMKFLDRIMFRGFINNSNQNISNKLKLLFTSIRDFNSIVNLFCLDDIASYLRGQIQQRLTQIKCKFDEFKKVLQFIMTEK